MMDRNTSRHRDRTRQPRLRQILTAIVVASPILGPAPAQAQRWTLPLDVQSQVDSVFDFIERDAPGCALGVYKDGILAYGRGYGLANLDWGVPITTSTVFDIGSVSKQFTAAAIALLDVEGVLSIDDDVRTWVPELPEYEGTITIRRLLNHTSGIRDYLSLLDMQGHEYHNVFDEFDGVELIVRQQGLNFEPGSEYLYSNSGYLLLANIVRRATGQSVRQFLEARFFDPLGMAHTAIWDNNTEIMAERAMGYGPRGAGWRIDHAWNFQMGGDGQVITSVDDLLKWDAMFYEPGPGGQALLDRLHTRGVLNSGDTIDYALGLIVGEYRGAPRVRHGGAWAGFRAQLVRFPEQRTSVALLCNRSNVNTASLTTDVVDVVLADHLDPPEPSVADPQAGTDSELFPREPVELTDAQLRRWEGIYTDADGGFVVSFRVREGRLFITSPAGPSPMQPYSENHFEIVARGGRVIFAGEGASRTVHQLGTTIALSVIEEHAPTPDELAQLAGTYHSPELDVAWALNTVDGRLTLERPGHDSAAVLLLSRDALSVDGFRLTVEWDGSRVTGFRVFEGRVTDILFARVDG